MADLDRGLFLGIDFGTTNCVVSIFDFKAGEAQTIPIDGGNVFPTAVQFEADPTNEQRLLRVFGGQAKESALILPQSTVLGVKRMLGNDEKVKITVDDKELAFAPERVAGEIIGYLKQKADEYVCDELGIDGKFSGCVVTVPANSTDKQKQRTKQAAMFAGFDEENVFIRLEPAAAAISYAVNEVANKKVLVYDFGGGTFDACILEIVSGVNDDPIISILSTYGDNSLGGNDVDKVVVDIIYEEFKRLTNGEIDLFDLDAEDGMPQRQKLVSLMRLNQMAIRAKERLSVARSAKIGLAPFIQEPQIVNINMEISLEKFLNHKRVNRLGDSDEVFAKFEGRSVADIIGMTVDCVDKCLEAARCEPEDITEVFLVGGSSAITLVGAMVEAKFKKLPFKSKISPALSISHGAAYYCGMIMMPTVSGPTVQERTVHPLGLEIAGRRFMQIVAQGVDIPHGGLAVEAAETLTTNVDSLTSMAIVVYENTEPSTNGEADMEYVHQTGMKRLAGTQLRGIPQAPRGQEQVKVVFSIGQDNMLRVMAQSTSVEGVCTELRVDDLY